MSEIIEIQKDVMDELKWEPFLNSSEIGVAVKNGIVTLSGIVDTYPKKLAAEKAAKRVSGVKAVAVEVQVGFSPAYRKTDTEIAEAVLDALKWHTSIKENNVEIKVEDGIVKLAGEVKWEYQRAGAKAAIENLAGVRAIVNLITIGPQIKTAEIRQKISAAFHRSATVDANKVVANVLDNKVILRGRVRSFKEKEDAEYAAWSAPGVLNVESRLEVEEPEFALDV